MNLKNEKTRARLQAKSVRARIHAPQAGVELIQHFPAARFRGQKIAGFWPLPGEVDILPLLFALHDMGEALCLPCTPRAGKPLTFRAWTPNDSLKAGPYGTQEPKPEQPVVHPDIVLMPLLAFTASGDRLGYGGGFYDRSLASLREGGDVFACGVAFAGQKAISLPVGEFDIKLDGILTEQCFREI